MTIPLAASADEAIQNIEKFTLASPQIDSRRLSGARAWYASKASGQWKFGPSKFIGYSGLDAKTYQKNTYELNGRVTEPLLQQWFVEVDESSDLYSELRLKLNEFLGKFGKKPSTATRISVPKSDLKQSAPADDGLVNLLAAAFKRLSPTEQQAFKQLIG